MKNGLRELMGNNDLSEVESLEPLIRIRNLCLRPTGPGSSEAGSEASLRKIPSHGDTVGIDACTDLAH